MIAALDDPHPDVRAAALDALTYLHDPASLPAIVVRLHDASLHPARRLAALAAFGPECESFLLDLSEVDTAHLAELRPSSRAVWHASLAAGTCAMDARRASRGPRGRL